MPIVTVPYGMMKIGTVCSEDVPKFITGTTKVTLVCLEVVP